MKGMFNPFVYSPDYFTGPGYNAKERVRSRLQEYENDFEQLKAIAKKDLDQCKTKQEKEEYLDSFSEALMKGAAPGERPVLQALHDYCKTFRKNLKELEETHAYHMAELENLHIEQVKDLQRQNQVDTDEIKRRVQNIEEGIMNLKRRSNL